MRDKTISFRTLRALLILFVSVHVSIFLYFFWNTIFPLPVNDMYVIVVRLLTTDDYFHELWRPRNVHRIVIPRLVFEMDLVLFDGLLYPISLLALLSGILSFGLLVRGVYKGMAREYMAVLCILLTALLWFRTFTLFPYIDNNSFGHVLVVAFALAATKLTLSHDRARMLSLNLAAGLGLAVGASVTLANGLLLWPILLWLAWRHRYRAATGVAIALCGGATMLAYGWDFPVRVVRSPVFQVMGEPFPILMYLISFFGAPWMKHPYTFPFGLALGVAVVVFSTVYLIRYGFRIRTADRFETWLMAMMLFCGGTAFMIAVGRVEFGYATITRYGGYAALMHICVIIAIAFRAQAWLERTRPRTLATVALLLISLALIPEQVVIGSRIEQQLTRPLQEAKIRLLQGERSPELFSLLRPRNPEIQHALDLWHARKLYLFRE